MRGKLMRQLVLAVILAGNASAAQIGAIKALRIGDVEWGKDDYFQLKWKYGSKDRFLGADMVASRKEVWVASVGYPNDEAKLTVLDAHGEAVSEAKLKFVPKKFKMLDMGKKAPMIVAWDTFKLKGFSAGGAQEWDFAVEKVSPSDFAVVSQPMGGPLVVASYNYGEAGLRAVGPEGKLAWQTPEISQAHWVASARMDGRTVLVATDGVGKAYVTDLKGKVVERIQNEGNSERLMIDGSDPKRAWMYSLDSGADSWRQKIAVSQSAGPVKKEASRWTPVSSEDLGMITTTAFTLGDFDGQGRRQPVIGTDNGWVLLLDQAGKIVTSARFRGKIQFLGAADLRGDKKEELVVGVEGFADNVFVFARDAR